MIGSVDGQVVRALGVCPGGLRRRDLFPLCDSAAEELDVSAALKRLKDDGYVEVASERKGATGAVYVLTGKGAEVLNAQAVTVDGDNSSAARMIDAVSVASEKLSSAAAGLLDHVGDHNDKVDIDVDHFDVIAKSLDELKKQVNPPRRPVDDLDTKLQCLNRLAVLCNQDIAELLNAIADDLEAA